MKRYQFNPNHFQTLVTAHILLKSLTNLPHSDFLLCKCLIDNSRVRIFIVKNKLTKWSLLNRFYAFKIYVSFEFF
jgi:translation initiation factor 3 subunit K